MADIEAAPITAVVAPTTLETQSQSSPLNSPSLKRSNSSSSAQPSKRPRLDSEPSHDPSHHEEEAGPKHDHASENVSTEPLPTQDEPQRAKVPSDTRSPKSTREDEKKRGRRLFGGLLGTLSQSSSSSAQRRRAEIEMKQQAKLKAQDEEHEEDKKRRLESLALERKAQQQQWDLQAMHLRHANLRATAKMLSTDTEPKIYYLPYELNRSEHEAIQRQIEDAESQIARESEDLKTVDGARESSPSYENKDRTEPRDPEQQYEKHDETENAPEGGHDNDKNSLENGVKQADAEASALDAAVAVEKAAEKADENDDVMVEAGEDSVIY
ncbi:MAG: hypothetical protein Q9159_007372 [Coniocarpon cinnabarinum]